MSIALEFLESLVKLKKKPTDDNDAYVREYFYPETLVTKCQIASPEMVTRESSGVVVVSHLSLH